MNREAIYVALYNLVVKATGITTTSRRLKHWADVPPGDQPALFMVQKSETAQVVTKQPTKWLLEVDLYIYVNTQNQAPGQALNPILDALTTVLTPANPDNVQTLSSLVQYARIEGRIETDEGALGDQLVAIVPIHILTT